MVQTAIADSYLVATRHLAMHCLPLAASAESWRGCLSDGHQDGFDLGCCALRQLVKEIARGHSSKQPSADFTLEEADAPSL